jgi:hypothetical protein
MAGMGDSEDGRDAGGGDHLGAWLRWSGWLATVLGVAALLSVAGMLWGSYLSGRPVDLLGMVAGAPGAGPPLPEGAVIAVQGGTCPRPWQPYLPAQGRFVLGAGAGEALNLDANGLLVPVRKPGETGGQAGVELLIPDIPPHAHRLSIAEVAPPPGRDGSLKRPPGEVAVGIPEAADGLIYGIITPFASKRGLGWRKHRVVDLLEPVGGVITSDRRFAARRHDNLPPFVSLTFCTYAPGTPVVAGAAE